MPSAPPADEAIAGVAQSTRTAARAVRTTPQVPLSIGTAESITPQTVNQPEPAWTASSHAQQLQRKVVSLTTELDALRRQLENDSANYAEDIALLRTDLSATRAAAKAEATRAAACTAEIASLRRALELAQANASGSADVSAALHASQAQCEQLREELASLHRQFSDQAEARRQLLNDRDEALRRVQAQTDIDSSLRRALEESQAQVQLRSRDCDEAQSQLQAAQLQCASLSGRCDGLAAQLSSVTADRDAAKLEVQNERDAARSNAQVLEAELCLQRNALREADRERESMRAQLSEAERWATQLQEQQAVVSDLQRLLEAERSQRTEAGIDASNRCATLQSELDRQTEELSAACQRVADVDSELVEVSGERDNAYSELRACLERIAELETCVSQLSDTQGAGAGITTGFASSPLDDSLMPPSRDAASPPVWDTDAVGEVFENTARSAGSVPQVPVPASAAQPSVSVDVDVDTLLVEDAAAALQEAQAQWASEREGLLASLQHKLDALSHVTSQLEAVRAQADAEVEAARAAMSTELEAARAHANELASQLQAAQAARDELNERLHSLASDGEALEQQLQVASLERETLTQQLASAMAHADGVVSNLHALASERDELVVALDNEREDRAAAEAVAADAEAVARDSLDAVAQLQRQHAAGLSQQRSSPTTELPETAALRDEVARLTDALSAAQSNRDTASGIVQTDELPGTEAPMLSLVSSQHDSPHPQPQQLQQRQSDGAAELSAELSALRHAMQDGRAGEMALLERALTEKARAEMALLTSRVEAELLGHAKALEAACEGRAVADAALAGAKAEIARLHARLEELTAAASPSSATASAAPSDVQAAAPPGDEGGRSGVWQQLEQARRRVSGLEAQLSEASAKLREQATAYQRERQAEMESLQSRVDELSVALATATSERDQATSRLARVVVERDSAAASAESLKAALGESESMVEDMSHNGKRLRQICAARDEEIESLQSQLDDALKQLDELRAQHDVAAAQSARALVHEMASAAAEHDRKIAAMNAQLESRALEVASLERQLSTAVESSEEQARVLGELTREIESLRHALGDARSTSDVADARARNLQSQLASAEASVARLQSQLAASQRDLAAAREERSASSNEVRSLSDELERTRAKLRERTTLLQSAQSVLSAAEGELRMAASRQTELEGFLSGRVGDTADLQARLSMADSELAALRSKHRAALERIAALEHEVAAARTYAAGASKGASARTASPSASTSDLVRVLQQRLDEAAAKLTLRDAELARLLQSSSSSLSALHRLRSYAIDAASAAGLHPEELLLASANMNASTADESGARTGRGRAATAIAAAVAGLNVSTLSSSEARGRVDRGHGRSSGENDVDALASEVSAVITALVSSGWSTKLQPPSLSSRQADAGRNERPYRSGLFDTSVEDALAPQPEQRQADATGRQAPWRPAMGSQSLSASGTGPVPAWEAPARPGTAEPPRPHGAVSSPRQAPRAASTPPSRRGQSSRPGVGPWSGERRGPGALASPTGSRGASLPPSTLTSPNKSMVLLPRRLPLDESSGAHESAAMESAAAMALLDGRFGGLGAPSATPGDGIASGSGAGSATAEIHAQLRELRQLLAQRTASAGNNTPGRPQPRLSDASREVPPRAGHVHSSSGLPQARQYLPQKQPEAQRQPPLPARRRSFASLSTELLDAHASGSAAIGIGHRGAEPPAAPTTFPQASSSQPQAPLSPAFARAQAAAAAQAAMVDALSSRHSQRAGQLQGLSESSR